MLRRRRAPGAAAAGHTGLLVGRPAEGEATADDAEEQADEEAAQVGREPAAQRDQDADDRVEQPLGTSSPSGSIRVGGRWPAPVTDAGARLFVD